MVKIREIKKQDRDAWCNFYEQMCEDEFLAFDPDENPSIWLDDILKSKNRRCYVAINNSEIIGYSYSIKTKKHTPWTISFGVLPHCRQWGLGKTLVKTLLRNSDDPNSFYAKVSKENSICQKLLDSLGFESYMASKNYKSFKFKKN
ncbi:GNAT family N-acetyltransferase [Candidatus Woesearchaeota archaeon]|nr:GNAT family N-acetyltransferase [Candidatus Woesearchaeota archaeon]